MLLANSIPANTLTGRDLWAFQINPVYRGVAVENDDKHFPGGGNIMANGESLEAWDGTSHECQGTTKYKDPSLIAGLSEISSGIDLHLETSDKIPIDGNAKDVGRDTTVKYHYTDRDTAGIQVYSHVDGTMTGKLTGWANGEKDKANNGQQSMSLSGSLPYWQRSKSTCSSIGNWDIDVEFNTQTKTSFGSNVCVNTDAKVLVSNQTYSTGIVNAGVGSKWLNLKYYNYSPLYYKEPWNTDTWDAFRLDIDAKNHN
jgi:hypothetical protein